MAVGQAVLTSTLDVGALSVAEARLEVSAVEDCARHGRLLRDVLELHAVLSAAGAGLATTAQVALLRQVSEQVAQGWLCSARLLVSLPGGLEALDCGLLTVPQSQVLTRLLVGLDGPVQLVVWERVQRRLLAAVDGGAVLPPARFAEEVRRAVIAADPAGAVERRRAAEQAGDVDYRRRDDGLLDLFALGITGPNAQAVLQRVRARAKAFGGEDERSAGKRRLDALVDLLLGRDTLPTAPEAAPGSPDGEHGAGGVVHCAPDCGCRLGSPVPCGAGVSLLVPLGAALGTTGELAELVGHGPVEPDLLQALLLAAPRIRTVWVDDDGIPVATSRTTRVPPRGDPQAVQDLLLRLAQQMPPEPPHPRHPDDHPPQCTDERPAVGGAAVASTRPAVLTRPHPAGTPGPYVVPAALRRLVQFRAPRCEWAGCGGRATGCDVDHDRAHPYGPTCGCNCGPLCRRHHRIKQLGVIKTRTAAGGVRWTFPTGRSWTSPAQHQPPAPAVRSVPFVQVSDEPDLGPDALAELLAADDDDPIRFELRSPDIDPDEPDRDRLGARIDRDTGWGLALDDPYRWAA